jgi:hypothetical protein
MLIVKEIKVQDIDENQIEWLHAPESYRKVYPLDKPISRDIPITTEMITGTICQTTDGREICIGMTKEVQKTIGSPFNTIELLRRLLKTQEAMQQSYINVAADIDREFEDYRYKIETMNIWKRIKTLFFGYKND